MEFSNGDLTLAHRTYGHGPLPVLAFHGFGRTGADFHVFEAALGDIATIHAFDLPFHGDSPSPSERAEQPFTPAELRDHFAAFADQLGAEKVVLMGYSLGGRVALSLLETMPERIARAVLIAPDGLKPRPWYRRLADSAWGRARYRRFIEHPERVHLIINTLHRLGLLRDKLHRFIIGQTDSIHKRRLLHDVWLSFRHIEVDLPALADRLRAHGPRVDLVFGTYDTVIKPKLGRPLATRAPHVVHVHEVPLGHQLLTPEVARRVAALLATDAARS